MSIRTLLRNKAFANCWRLISPAYNFVLKHSIYRHGVEREIWSGQSIRVCYENRRLKPANKTMTEFQWIAASIKPDMTVLDIGANIGIFSILFGRVIGDSGRVFAFEPSPVPFGDLQHNIQLNGLSERVKSHQIAIGNRSGKLEFYLTDDPRDTQHSAIPPTTYATVSEKIEVPMLTLDSFCMEGALSPDVIKIDVEGFEPFVLEGARNTIQRAKTLTVFIELHPWAWDTIGYNKSIFHNLLRELGLQPVGKNHTLDENHIRLQKVPPETNT